MAASQPALYSLIKSEYQSRMLSNFNHDPFSMKITKYLIEMLNAFSTGIALDSTTLAFNTQDKGLGGTPSVQGAGLSNKITVNALDMTERIYTKVRTYAMQFGRTAHEVWPPSQNNSGYKLRVLCEAVAYAVQTHYSSCWTLTSTHPKVYKSSKASEGGFVVEGGFYGLIPNIIHTDIKKAAPSLRGVFWPYLAQAVAEGYVESIHQKATAKQNIIGFCTSSPGQVCNIENTVGTGTGVVS